MSGTRRAHQPPQEMHGAVSQPTRPEGNRGPRRGPQGQNPLGESQRQPNISWNSALVAASATNSVHHNDEHRSREQDQRVSRTRGQNTARNVASSARTRGISQQVVPQDSYSNFAEEVASLTRSKRAVSSPNLRSREALRTIQERYPGANQRGNRTLTVGATHGEGGRSGPSQRCATYGASASPSQRHQGEARSLHQQGVHGGSTGSRLCHREASAGWQQGNAYNEGRRRQQQGPYHRMRGSRSEGHLEKIKAMPSEHFNEETRALYSKYGEVVKDLQHRLFYEESPGVTSTEHINPRERTMGAQRRVHDEVRGSRQDLFYPETGEKLSQNVHERGRGTQHSSTPEAARDFQPIDSSEETNLQRNVPRQEDTEWRYETIPTSSGGPPPVFEYEETIEVQHGNPHRRNTDGQYAGTRNFHIYPAQEGRDTKHKSAFTAMGRPQYRDPMEGTSRSLNADHHIEAGNLTQRSLSVNSPHVTSGFQQVVSNEARGPHCQGVHKGTRSLHRRSSPGEVLCTPYMASTEGNVCSLQNTSNQETQHKGPYDGSYNLQPTIHPEGTRNSPQRQSSEQHRTLQHEIPPEAARDYQQTGTHEGSRNLRHEDNQGQRITTPFENVPQGPSQSRGQAVQQPETRAGREGGKTTWLWGDPPSPRTPPPAPTPPPTPSTIYSQQQLQIQVPEIGDQPQMESREPVVILALDQRGRSPHRAGAEGGSEGLNLSRQSTPARERRQRHLEQQQQQEQLQRLLQQQQGQREAPESSANSSPLTFIERSLDQSDQDFSALQRSMQLAGLTSQDVSVYQQNAMTRINDLFGAMQSNLDDIDNFKDLLTTKVTQISGQMQEIKLWTRHMEAKWTKWLASSQTSEELVP